MSGARIEDLRSSLDQRGLDCLIVTSMQNIRYLSGFSGSSAVLLVGSDRQVLITDGRYAEQAAREAYGWDVRVYSGSLADAITASMPDTGRCGFESTVSFDFHRKLSQAAAGRELEPLDGVVEELRMLKDASEVASIRSALECASEAFEHVLSQVRPGLTERELAAEFDYRMTLAGADGPAFDTVVASGPNSALPHAPLTDRAIAEGDMLVMDFGARKDGYCSDTTRTACIGRCADPLPGALDAVNAAVEAAMGALEPGARAADVDAAARAEIARRGLTKRFTHSLGHGVGLETHEKPALSSQSKDSLMPGMVFTVEPGVYIPGIGGARTEELVLITEGGYELLSEALPRELLLS